MTIFIIIAGLWIASGVYSVGHTKAWFNMTYSRNNLTESIFWALAGPLDLIVTMLFLRGKAKPRGWSVFSWNKWW